MYYLNAIKSLLARKRARQNIQVTIEPGNSLSCQHTNRFLRPLEHLVDEGWFEGSVTTSSLQNFMVSPHANQLEKYFEAYPATSLMGGLTRALIFAVVRMYRPAIVAEIGTMHGGGAEIIARALWENGNGFLHTCEPYHGKGFLEEIDHWPAELRNILEFHPLNSMDFLLKLKNRDISPDLFLIDGDHDFEFVLFDLYMAARLLQPGGLILINDSVQTGPLQATRLFMANHPTWRELGGGLSSFDLSAPFAGGWVSLPNTGLIILQAPLCWSVGSIPVSWGQKATELISVASFSMDLAAQVTAGTLHYQAILRQFGNGAPLEDKRIGSVQIKLTGIVEQILVTLHEPMVFNQSAYSLKHKQTFEIELCWQPSEGSSSLLLNEIPLAYSV